MLTGDQFDFLPIPNPCCFMFFGSDQAQHQWLDVECGEPGAALHLAGGRARCAGSSAPTSIADRPLHLDRQRVRPRHRRVPEVKRDARCRCSHPQFTFLADSQDNLAWAVFGERELRRHRPARELRGAALRQDERENTTETPPEFIPAAVHGADPAFHRPGAQGDLGRAAAEGDVALQAERRRRRSTSATAAASAAAVSTRPASARRDANGIAGISDLFDEETADTYESRRQGAVRRRSRDDGRRASTTRRPRAPTSSCSTPTRARRISATSTRSNTRASSSRCSAQRDRRARPVRARRLHRQRDQGHRTRSPSDVGNQAPLVSEYTVNLGAQYPAPRSAAAANSSFAARISSIIGDTWWYPDNFTERDPVELLDLRAGVESDTGRSTPGRET